MTDPERSHTSEPAEGGTDPGRVIDERTPHPEEPAEGQPLGDGPADSPSS